MKIEFSTELFRATNLSALDMIVLMLHEHTHANLIHENIATELNMSVRSIYRTRANLVHKKFLVNPKRGRSGKWNGYKMTDKLANIQNDIKNKKQIK